MHSFWIRANAVFFFGLGVLAGLASLNVFSTWLDPVPAPTVNRLAVHELRRFHKFRNTDRAILTLDMDIDMAPIWNWNVKQIYVFVFAEYKGKVNSEGTAKRKEKSKRRNHVVLFDHIITSKEATRILGNDLIKYPLQDDFEELKDVSITLRLGYDIHPLFGPLQLFGSGRKVIPFPEKGQGSANYTFPTVYY